MKDIPKAIVKLRPSFAVRQGDAIIQRRRQKDLPPNLPIHANRALAVGTRASHVVTEPADLLDGRDGTVWIVAPAAFEVRHTEEDATKRHKTIQLGAGVYQAWKQVEFPSGLKPVAVRA